MAIQTYDTHTLAGVIEGFDQFTPFLLDRFFPMAVTYDTSFIDFDVLETDYRIAPFVSPVQAGQVMKALGGTTKKFTPAYVKPKGIVDPEKVLTRRAGEAIGGSLSPAARRDAIIADLLNSQRKQITRTWEWMAAQALLTGKVVVSGENYPEAEVDFGRAAGNTKALTGTARWSQSGVDPLADLEGWFGELEAPATDVVMSADAWALFYAKVKGDWKDLADITIAGNTAIINVAPGNGQWVQWKGRVGNVNYWVYTGMYKDAAGATQLYIPSEELIIGSAAVEGHRCFGAIQDANVGYMPGEIVPRNWVNEDPGVEYVMSQSAPLMVPARPNASMRVKVNAAA